VECDASDHGISAILMREGRPLAYESSQLKGKNLVKPIYVAILHAVQKWCPYLVGRHFKVQTDHDSSKYLLKQQLSSKEKQKWITNMLGYNFEVIYKKGKHKVVANALSRKEEETKRSLCFISILQSNWVEEARTQDQEVCKIIQQLHEDLSSIYNFVWKNELLWYHDRLYLCKNSQLKQNILLELHTSLIGGHSGFLKTYHGIKKDFL
jgi:hypothetical protein